MSIEWLMLSSSTSPVVVRESALMILSIGHCQLLMADCWKIDVFELWCWRRLLRVPWTAGRSTSPCKRRSVLSVYWKDWCWSWNSNTLATWSEELTHLKRPWCWERSKVRGKGDNRGWDGWIASLTQWTWLWVNSRSWWWTGMPRMLQSMGLQRVGHDWATELNWIPLSLFLLLLLPSETDPKYIAVTYVKLCLASVLF